MVPTLFFYFFFRVPGGYRPHKSTYTHSGGLLAKLGYLVRPWLEPATPSTEKQADGFFTSAELCAKTWVLPMELGGSWCYHGPLAGP